MIFFKEFRSALSIVSISFLKLLVSLLDPNFHTKGGLHSKTNTKKLGISKHVWFVKSILVFCTEFLKKKTQVENLLLQ